MERDGSVKRLQEFMAHSNRTNCAHVGRSTGTVLATGGDDFLVNIWAVGKTGAILTLPSHTSPVTCVCFDKKEESILAGSQKATIKLFDLEGARVKRTIAGHRAAVSALDFHTLGHFFASGSADTNVKLWDSRSRACVCTYKGHRQGVTVMYFSPDSKWLASGSDDCNVKVG
jgi:katanin p80 WD40 repeat-containing subunit B1